MTKSFAPLSLLCLLTAMAAGCGKSSESESHADDHAQESSEHRDAHEVSHDDDHGSEDGQAEKGHDDHEESEVARIDPQTAAKHGIQVATAGAGVVPESISLTGRLIVDPRRIALVRARFAGPVRGVSKEVGDSVRQGDVLARVESNDSLTVYDVRSPIAGIVLERMTNPGDVAGSEPLFRIGDLANLQAELKVFPHDQGRVQRGAEAIVRIGDDEVRGKVVGIVPEIDSRTQAALVRVSLAAKGPVRAAPGQFVAGRILVGDGVAAVAIPADAVQRFEGKEVIFVPTSEGFEPRPVSIGRRTLDLVEITEGLAAGESYVSAGAFLVKAEIGKGSADHDH